MTYLVARDGGDFYAELYDEEGTWVDEAGPFDDFDDAEGAGDRAVSLYEE